MNSALLPISAPACAGEAICKNDEMVPLVPLMSDWRTAITNQETLTIYTLAFDGMS